MVVKKSGQPRKTWLKQYTQQLVSEDVLSLMRQPYWQELYRQHPIQVKLHVIYTNFSAQRDFLLEQQLQAISEEKWDETVDERLEQINSVESELLPWLGGPRPPLTEDEIRKALSDIASSIVEYAITEDAYLSPLAIKRMLEEHEKEMRRKPKGRPPDRRPLAVRALEMRLANPKLKLRDLTKEICPCAKKEHDVYCQQAIRQGIIALKKVLRKYKISY